MTREGFGGEKEQELWKYSREELKEKREKEADKARQLDKEAEGSFKKHKLAIEAVLFLGSKEVIDEKDALQGKNEGATMFATAIESGKKGANA